MLQCGAGQLALGLAHLAVHLRSAGLNVSSNPLCGLTSVYQIPPLARSFFLLMSQHRPPGCPPTVMAVCGVNRQNWFPLVAGGVNTFNYKGFVAKNRTKSLSLSLRWVQIWWDVHSGFTRVGKTNAAASPECNAAVEKWTVGGAAAAELPWDHA